MTQHLEDSGYDTGRFLTVFSVTLQSVKKIEKADVVAGINNSSDATATIVQRRVDPNITHPLRQMDILDQIGNQLNGIKFTKYVFQAILHTYDLRNKANMYWKPARYGTPQYSRNVIQYLNSLTGDEITLAIEKYKDFNRNKRMSNQK